MQTTAWLILALPLAGSLITSLGYKIWPSRIPGFIGTAAIFGAFVCTVLTLIKMQDLGEEERQVLYVGWDYANTVGVDAKVSILIDPLSIYMALVVTGVSTLIHLYSISYMWSDKGYTRFFAYLNFFVFSMLVLVLAGNFFLLVVGWAFVGFASYALVSFWYRRKSATRAGMKAFVINVVGDIGLTLAAFLIFRELGTFDYGPAFERAPEVYTHNQFFFSYLIFFFFSLLFLVLAGNFFLLVFGWAFVGAASYLLISFWYRRETATKAGIKAFVINVVGDVGLVLGAYFIFKGSGTLDYLGTFEQAGSLKGGDLTAGCILLLVGAFAKSAQIPLHTWLPDAMEGPTPVSALIHAATMVTAGVYLIARMWPLFEQAPAAADVGAVIGVVTLLVAGTIGLVVTDLKRVIAYSTMSQIGYMVMAVSAGAYAAGLFHLMTHAFFKALLFMAAGSVIAAMAGEQNLDKMGGFRKAMPFTFACMVIGGLCLAGIPPFSGFFSKDEIIALMGERGGWHWILFGAGYVGSFITAVYTWRMIFRAFFGEPVAEARELEGGHLHHAEVHRNPATGEEEDTDVGFPGADHHIAEREWSMKAAMAVLAVGAVVLGALQIPFHTTSVIHDFLKPSFEGSKYYEHLEPSDGFTAIGLIIGAVLGVAGIALAYRIWVQKPGTSARVQERFAPLHRLFSNKWYFDELIDVAVVRPFAWFGRFGQQTFERLVVQGTLVGGTTSIVRAGSATVRALQSGLLRSYAALLVLGTVAVGLYFLLQA